MRNIAVIEDEDVHAAKLEENLSLYQKEYHCEFRVVRFRTAEDFLADYRSAYAVVFMDIQLPGMNGMEAAFKLRTLDKTVSLIFITSLSQYAQKGYEVDAVGYLLKPVSYYDFSLKFRKALDLYVMAEERNVSLDVPELFIGVLSDQPETLRYLDGVGVSYSTLRTRTFEMEEDDFPRDETGLNLLDVLVVAPCTGNTLGKLSCGITDTAVTMAVKAHLRNERPVVLAVASNDGLSGAARNLGELLVRKNYYFVPFGQDNAAAKPCSLVADFGKIPETVDAALQGEQLQPVLLR